jgi:hypothetical protein
MHGTIGQDPGEDTQQCVGAAGYAPSNDKSRRRNSRNQQTAQEARRLFS